MADVKIEVKIYIECHECGRDLVAHVNRGDISVEPCETCMENAKEPEA